MGWITGIVEIFRTISVIIKGIRALYEAWKDHRESQKRKEFEDGVKEKDSKKIEDAFDSPRAGKPSGDDVDEFKD